MIGYLLSFVLLVGAGRVAADVTPEQAREAMARATQFFRTEVATEGGYLGTYSEDLKLRQGERPATDTNIWIQPPGTPAVGMAMLDAYAATGDTLYLNGAIDVARALVYGQLSTGGWDYEIEFDPILTRRSHYRRDVEAGETDPGSRRHRSVFDDDTSQAAMRLLMRVDKLLGFKDADIHGAVKYGLDAFLRVQYPNGAWPQRWESFPDPEKYPVLKAKYPDSWSRVWPNENYREFYTFNDNAIADVIDVMLEAHRIYGVDRYLKSALKGGDFMILAQMPEPQPAWAQQYNHQMEPVWARKFEPPSVTGGESFGVMQSLIDLYVLTGKERFLEPIDPALAWANRSLRPDGNMARFYELQTNTPLYFVKDSYKLTYSDENMPTHYAFIQRSAKSRIQSVENRLGRARSESRERLAAERIARWPSRQFGEDDREEVARIAAALDDRGRWVEDGQIRVAGLQDRPKMRVITCRTFNDNLRMLAWFVSQAEE